ncbi:MAG: DUF4350 domain-containing protein [Mycobacteriales bacterium]
MSAVAEAAPLDFGAWVRRLRGPAAFVVIGLALVALFAAIGRAPNSTPLDPRNASANGTRALAALLAERGDTVAVAERVSELSGRADATVVLSAPGTVSDDSLHAISASLSTLVVLEPDDRVLNALGVEARFDDVVPEETLEPGCQLPAAVTAGTAVISGFAYRVNPVAAGATTTCYNPAGNASILAVTRPSGGRTVVVGSAGTLTNAHLAAEGDAALALGLIDNPTVDWAPRSLQAANAPRSQQGLFNLLPSRLLWATLQLFLAVVVLALWRARRLGPLVAERLPVVVRAAETVEGSGRLLHAARARAGAADALRMATVARLARLLRVGTDHGPNAVTPVVAEHTGRPPTAVNELLYGGAPSDDATLVRLAGELASLETEVRRDTNPGGQR